MITLWSSTSTSCSSVLFSSLLPDLSHSHRSFKLGIAHSRLINTVSGFWTPMFFLQTVSSFGRGYVVLFWNTSTCRICLREATNNAMKGGVCQIVHLFFTNAHCTLPITDSQIIKMFNKFCGTLHISRKDDESPPTYMTKKDKI